MREFLSLVFVKECSIESKLNEIVFNVDIFFQGIVKIKIFIERVLRP